MKYESLIKEMTLVEKASLLSGKDFWQSVDIKRLGIPSIIMSDGPHGIRKQAGSADHLGLNASVPATCYPTAAAIANSWDPELGEEIGRYLGAEAVSQNVNVLLGPGLNIKRSPLCGRNFEYFSEDPYLSGKMAAGYIKGIQEKGIAACPKHFAANSQELRRLSNDSVVDERTFREIYTTAFEIAVKEGSAKSIMTSYNKINGVYANENEHLLQEILVDEWGFEGCVISDWGASNSHVEGVKAGSHLEMPSTGRDGIRELIKGIQEGVLEEKLLDQRVDELLEVIFKTHRATSENNNSSFDIEKHHKMAEKAAQESVVLLKNENKILPLKTGTKVAIVGDFAKTPRYQGAGSSMVNPTKLDNTLEAVSNTELKVVGYEQGFLRNGKKDDHLKKQAVELSKQADVVLLYLGLDELAESEGMDRTHMRIAQNQIEVLKAIEEKNPNIVVVLSAGAAVEMPWLSHARALVHGYLSGQAGAGAVLNVLIGKVCPSGRLSETYPMKYADTPAYSYYPGEEKTAEYREGLYVGYRYYETAHVDVLFPFGYGLSYTTFEFTELKVDSNHIRVKVTNTGEVDGAEVVQLYIGANNAKVYRPMKELKGFQKVYLKAGESQLVTIDLDDKAFRYYNSKTHQWEVESGVYTIMVGSNVADIKQKAEITIVGTAAAEPNESENLASYYKADIKNVSDSQFETLLGHPIPDYHWNKNHVLDINDAICQMYYAKSGLARLIYKILTSIKDKSMKKGKPNLNILFIYNMPFRGIAKMTGGVLTMDMTYGLLDMVNGHFFRGLKKLVKGFFENNKK